jgi:hypothetical protein
MLKLLPGSVGKGLGKLWDRSHTRANESTKSMPGARSVVGAVSLMDKLGFESTYPSGYGTKL